MNIDLSKYQGLIFDMDGTLLDTMPFHVAAWEMTAEAFGIPFDREWIHSLGGMPSKKITMEINKRFNLELDPVTVSSFKMKKFAELDIPGDVIDHTYQVLKSAQGKYKTAIGTGSLRENAHKLLGNQSLIPLFDAIVTASDVKNHKPNPDTFLLAAEKIEVKPSDCVVFEDTELGKQAAHAAGMDCIMVVGEQFEFYPLPA
ncbi:beta-phosphoglucomutase family hydrolase [Vibrio sp. JC009]|uniref:beta-phosphoglucomutase family hydrolase n=1 Tax=Vibrio sp. JC009 TaxID=2912314 RepID=UPI0023B1C657|nr:beta-phosphoglucomutase family hydrolase [Vibrio sp. JC009]WED24244.1 beta-phosphoglucomutase family hydrolase [Vibrio sp. JC009]